MDRGQDREASLHGPWSLPCGCIYQPGIDLPVEECAWHAADPDLAHPHAMLTEILARVRDLSVRSEPAARESVRTPSAALPEGSAWVRALVAKILDLPDAEFLMLANKVMGRYAAAMDALAPPGVPPVSLQEDT